MSIGLPKDSSPRVVKLGPPTDADIADVIHKMSRRIIRKLRQFGYLELSLEVPVATGHDPLAHDEPELAHNLAASIQQRIAFGERAGQKVRRIGSGFGVEDERTMLTGKRCASIHGFSLHANTQVPAHRRDQLERLIRYTARGAVSLDRQSPLRLIAAITDPTLIRRILSYLKLSPNPPPIEPARWAQAPFAWTSP